MKTGLIVLFGIVLGAGVFAQEPVDKLKDLMEFRVPDLAFVVTYHQKDYSLASGLKDLEPLGQSEATRLLVTQGNQKLDWGRVSLWAGTCVYLGGVVTYSFLSAPGRVASGNVALSCGVLAGSLVGIAAVVWGNLVQTSGVSDLVKAVNLYNRDLLANP